MCVFVHTHHNIPLFMDKVYLFFISLLSLLSIILLFKPFTPRKRRNLAPSPPSLPVIGHLHLTGEPFHRVLHQLSSKYGPVMSLRFGSRQILVVTSPSAVEECFTTHDIVLANRPLLLSGKYLDYDHTTMGSAPYGRLWRDLRRISTLELFSAARLKAYMGVRQDEVRSLVKSLSQDVTRDFTRVEMKSRIEGLSYNIIMRIVADKRFYGTEVDGFEEARKFKDLIREIFDASGASNAGDFIPFLRWMDFQGFEKKLRKLQTESDSFIQRLIEERRSKRHSCDGKAKTFIDTMLSLQESEPEYYTDDIIKGNMLTMLIAGTDTSSVTIEWGMSLLLNHPDVLNRARAEIDEHIGHDRLVEETDLPNLPYIQCIVHESLRLFPAAPLLVAHEASEDCTIGGFDVTRGTIVLVNAWAIHRDPQLWDEPFTFKPERFEEIGNTGYRFIPFGMGRRQCPGAGFANRVVGTMLASLIQCFEWKRDGDELVDLSEGKGLTMPKIKPLKAMCKVRQIMSEVLMEL
ncbi:hypothetical protein OSB04_025269 [Centaurea solstitialis]|uniref:Cytochrome P450 n=1 Tax=Centaurea solstitialis TaxID=347529 RepID=A0AA38T697_9ASTR|nr:hypothetical protein OSB04_025269 [Centaurea solstitialis]